MIDMTEVQMIVLVMFLLGIKHFIADFVLQTNRMVEEKGIYLKAHGIYHSAIQAAGTFLALAWIHPALGLVFGIFDFLAHYHIDWAKMKINRHFGYTPKDDRFWVLLGLDQLLHYLTYVLIIGWVFFAF
jgi:hypothetical protein